MIRLGMTMINEMKRESQDRPDAVVWPLLTSYDSGYEHSLEHWIEVQHLVNEAEGGFLPLTFAAHRSTGGGMKPKVLFLCTGNSARSQMAEGYLGHVGSDRFEAMSAGIEPKGLNPLAVEAMEEIGIDISHQTSKDVASLLGQHIPYVVTVCDNAKERCPTFPGAWKFLHWSLEDPAAAQGTREQRLEVFRRVRDRIVEHIEREFVGGKVFTRRA